MICFKRTIRSAIVGFFMLMTCSVFSQESSSEAVGDESKSSTNIDPSSNTSADRRGDSESKPKQQERVFKPSEEISEDSPVPFPVDI